MSTNNNQQQESLSTMTTRLVTKRTNIIQILRENHMDFNDVFILECFEQEEELQFFEMFEVPSIRDFNISTRFQALKKLQFLVEDPENTSRIILSVKGKEILNQLHSEKVNNTTATTVVVNPEKIDDKKFEEWWKCYPSSTAWKTDDKQTSFIGSRALKNLTKSEAKKRYLKLLNQGLKHEDLLGSLKYEIKLKKLDSIKKNQNQMEYFKGMESYFNQEKYFLYMDNYRNNPSFIGEEEKVKSKKLNVTDI